MSSLTLEVVEAFAAGTSRSVPMLMVTVAFAALCIVAVNAALARRRLLHERGLADRAAARQNEAFGTAMANMSNGLVMISTDGVIIAINHQTEPLRCRRRLRSEYGRSPWSETTERTATRLRPANAVRMVFENLGSYPDRAAAIRAIAPKIGCSRESLLRWVVQTEADGGAREGVTGEERARIKDLEREVRELRQADEILRKASACFA